MTRGLRSVLTGWRAPALPALAQVVQETTERAEVAVTAKLGRRKAAAPSVVSIAAARLEVEMAWHAGTVVNDMPWQSMKLVPYFMFGAGSQGGWSPIEDDRFLASWLRFFTGRRGSKGVRILIEEYLRQYPARDLPGLARVRDIVRNALRAQPLHPRLEHWKSQHALVGLFDANGPERLARAIDDPRAVPTAVVKGVGFTEPILPRARFLMVSLAALAVRLRNHLERNELAPQRLEALLQAFRDEKPKHLLFHDELGHRGAIVDALLMPWVGGRRSPDPTTREVIKLFLMQCVGDPRTHSVVWQPVSAEARAVMLGWLVEDTFEFFFGLVDDTAIDYQWQYRRAFWGAYLAHGAIREAWVVLGRDAHIRGAREIERVGMACGSLEGAGDPSQSVLLMSIGDITVAEWSHNGACRMWDAGQGAAPQLHRSKYSADDLRRGASYERRHDGSQTYRWQEDVRSRIFGTTGIDVRRGDYEV